MKKRYLQREIDRLNLSARAARNLEPLETIDDYSVNSLIPSLIE